MATYCMAFDNKGGIKKGHSTLYGSVATLQYQRREMHEAIEKNVHDYGGTLQLVFS